MKFLVLSDTHSLHEQVKIEKCDVLLYAGDYTGNGSLQHTLNFAKWLYNQPAKRKVVVAGNHDGFAESNHDITKQIFSQYHITYLENQTTVIDGIKIFGTPFTPEFMNWHFMLPRDQMYKKVWSKVPKDTNILLSHGPAYGLLDLVDNTYNEDHHVGCKGLLQRLGELKELKYLVCGHIHNQYGSIKQKMFTVINCSATNEQYQIVNIPKTFNI